MNPPKPDIMVH